VRVAALLAGVTILIGASVTMIGLALVAPLTVWLAYRIQRARGRSLSIWGSWMAAVTATLLTIVIVAGFFAARVPAGTWRSIRHAADSASAESAKLPPPAWLNKLAPNARRYPMPQSSPTLNAALFAWGLLLGGTLVAAVVGTVGWAGTMLLVLYRTGNWWREPRASEDDLDVVTAPHDARR
jgi:hypothetical protein